MGEVEAAGSRDMVRFPDGRGWLRARAKGGAEVYQKAGTAVCARTEKRAATKVCTRTEITAVGRLIEKGAARCGEAAKVITTSALDRRDGRRNVD
jgi:hypothetical protein